jgi:opacity protein-like surface antigen
MGVLKSLAMMGVAALSMLSAARAADMAAMPEIPSVDGAAIEPELGTNWYLRGDISAVFSNAKFDATVGATTASVSDDHTGWGGTIGAGYDFGWFRSDITLDYIGDRGVSFLANGDCLDLSGATCLNNHKSTFNAVPLLFNAYFDLGTWSGLTPYIGAGAGASLVSFDDWTVTSPGIPPALPVSATVGGDDNWRFTWAVMAGVSYALNQNLAIDLGYRFLDIQNGKAVRTVIPTGGTIDYSDLYSQEIRLGFRWLVD